MKIKQITLNNFRAYQGVNKYTFSNKKHINIISAENGNGKTSFLTSIICCLYGSEMFGSTHKTKSYYDFIMNSKNKNSKSNKMYIEIDFIHINSVFNVKRIYNFFNDDFIEKLIIHENGKPLKNFTINSIIPLNLMELFFFDGEKILKIIDEGTFSNYIINLISKSFEIDIFEILKKDVNTSIQNDFKLNKTDDYNDLLKKQKELSKDLEYYNDKIKESENKIFINQSNIQKLETLIEENNLLKNKDLAILTSQNEKFKNKINCEQEKLNKFIKNELNLFLHKKYLIHYSLQLDESRFQRLKLINEAYTNFDDTLDIGIPYYLEKQIINNSNIIKQYDLGNVKNLIKSINLNQKEYIKHREKIKQNSKGIKYLNFSDNYELYENQNLEEKENLKILKSKTIKLQKEYDLILNKIELEEKKILENELVKNSMLEKNKLENVILEYIDQQKKFAYNEIGKEVLKILQSDLLHKKQLIDGIEFSNDNIILKYDEQKINIEQLSAGEKQVIIVGFIFAIIKCSNIENPLILDTFIGRLDITHTKNLLEYLTNNYNKQVIFLSTNREIGTNEIKILKNSLDKHYLLKNNGYKINIGEVK